MPAATAATESATAESLGWQLRGALPPMRLHSVSLYDNEGNVLWLSEGVLGPDEHNLVLEALEALREETTQPFHECGMEDGRIAIFLAVRAPQGDLVGLAMILADMKSLPEGIFERLSTPQVRTILQKVAVLLRARAPKAGGAEKAATTGGPAPAPAATAVQPEDAGSRSDSSVASEVVLSPQAVDELLELEIVPDPPRDLASSTASTELAAPTARHTPPQASSMKPASATPAPASPPEHADSPRTAASSIRARVAFVAAAAADLVLYTQQLVRVRASGRTRRYEVLARSRRDAGQVPSAFLSESAQGREGAALDGLIVQRLLSWLGEHREVWEAEPTSFSINLSLGALEDERFPNLVASCLVKSGVAPASIGFEIPESAYIRHRAHVLRFLEAVERLGCFVVIDDFTLDSGATAMLRSKALRLVKLDPNLTAAAMKDKLSQALVVAILQAAKVLGIHCVAKRVESQSALQWLGAVGCDFAQGFLVDKPQPLEALLTAPAG